MEFSYESSPAIAKLGARRFIERRAGVALVFVTIVAAACSVAFVLGFHHWYAILCAVLSDVYTLIPTDALSEEAKAKIEKSVLESGREVA